LLLTKFVIGIRSESEQVHSFIERDLGGRWTFVAHHLERTLRRGSVPCSPALCECSIHDRRLSGARPFRTIFDGERTSWSGEHI
jgi:hypothetical protein